MKLPVCMPRAVRETGCVAKGIECTYIVAILLHLKGSRKEKNKNVLCIIFINTDIIKHDWKNGCDERNGFFPSTL